MQQVSERYREQQSLPIAGAMLMRISFGLVDPDAAGDAVVTGAGECYSTPATIIYEEAVPTRVYATLERGRMKADGSQLILPHNPAARQGEGFVSAQVSDAEGRFTLPPAVEIAFSTTHTVPALTFVFDRVMGTYPAEVRVEAWRGGTAVCNRIVHPTSADCAAEVDIERFDRMRITMLSMAQPYRRARLQQLMFGINMMFDNSIIGSASHKQEIDPISRRLPKSSMQFSLINTNTLTADRTGMYDPDNPSGVWKYMEKNNPIIAEYGQQLGDGDVEWFAAGRFYLNAAPVVSGLYAKFTAYDLLDGMNGTYSRGVWDNRAHSLLELATAVLEDTGIPRLSPTQPMWRLWAGLGTITTTAPLPVKKHKELLQYIAHAACCVLYCDRSGIINICPAPTVSYPLMVDLDQMRGQPKASKIPVLYRVDCPAYSYSPEVSATELHSGKYTVAGECVVRLSYSSAVVDSVVVQGATLVSQELYAQSARLKLVGNGTATVSVTGRTLATSKSLVSSQVQDGDENGAIEQLDNPLVTDMATAANVAQWVRNYLRYRTSYEFGSRGSPECDPLDIIKMQSAFDAQFAALVVRNEITFDGSIAGKMLCKRLTIG